MPTLREGTGARQELKTEVGKPTSNGIKCRQGSSKGRSPGPGIRRGGELLSRCAPSAAAIGVELHNGCELLGGPERPGLIAAKLQRLGKGGKRAEKPLSSQPDLKSPKPEAGLHLALFLELLASNEVFKRFFFYSSELFFHLISVPRAQGNRSKQSASLNLRQATIKKLFSTMLARELGEISIALTAIL